MSAKPTKDELPYWVRFIAQNKNGEWRGYEVEPCISKTDPVWITGDWTSIFRATDSRDQPDNDEWKQTLQRVPEWKLYINQITGFQLELRPYILGEDISHVRLDPKYTPKEGDMIARDRFYLRNQSHLPQSKFTTYFGAHATIREIE